MARGRAWLGLAAALCCAGLARAGHGTEAETQGASGAAHGEGAARRTVREALFDEASALAHKLESTLHLAKGPSAGASGGCDTPVATVGSLRRASAAARVRDELDALEERVNELLAAATGVNASGNATAEEDDVEGEIERKCLVPRFGLRLGLIGAALLLVGAPLLYVLYNRKSIIDSLCDREFETLDVDSSNSINADEFYIAVLQLYLKVNRVQYVKPPSYAETKRYFQDGHEMDRAEFKQAIAILIDTTLKRLASSIGLALLMPWLAPIIVDTVWLLAGPALYVADASSCGHAVMTIVGSVMNRQLFITLTSVALILIALPRVFMWIDDEEKQQLEGEKDVSIIGRIKMLLRAPKLVQSQLTKLESKFTKKLSDAAKQIGRATGSSSPPGSGDDDDDE